MKGKITKSALAACLAVLMLCTVCLPVNGKTEYASLIVLGDSISTGYGLPDYDSTDPYNCRSYANLLADAMELKANRSYKNYAVNGATSRDLLSQLQTYKGDISKADLIVISVGGNDLIGAIPAALNEILPEMQFESFYQAASAIAAMSEEVLGQIFGGQVMRDLMEKTVSDFKRNVKSIISFIRKQNETAKLVFLAQYDPVAGVENYAGIGKFEASFIGMLNAALAETASGKAEVADVPSVMRDATESTNIKKFDIHPNETGHAAIFGLLASMLDIEVKEVQTEIQTEAETEVQTEVQTAAQTEAETEKLTELLTEAVTEGQTKTFEEAVTEKHEGTETKSLTGDTERADDGGILTIGASESEEQAKSGLPIWAIPAAASAAIGIAVIALIIVLTSKKKK